jgi:hypothetical protein
MAVMLSALWEGGPLPPGRMLVLISVRGRVELRTTVLLEGLGQLKYLVTALGIKPATFRFLLYCLNQLGYCFLLALTTRLSRVAL